MTKKPNVAPIVGELAKVIRVTGLTVTQTVDGEGLCFKFPFDIDGHQLIFQIDHEDVDELVDTIKVTAEEMWGVRARRRAA